jgi:predicted transcriptional regulator
MSLDSGRKGSQVQSTEGTLERLRVIEVAEDRLRSALTVWADDVLLVAKLDELEREAKQLRDAAGLAATSVAAVDSRV